MSDNELDVLLGDEKKEGKKEEKKGKEEVKFKPGVGVDIGTSFIVVVRQTEDGSFVNKFHRNCLLPMDINDDSVDLIERGNYSYIKTDGKYWILGDDCINLVNAVGRGNIVRPMKGGLLNPNLKESSELLFLIIKSVVGKPIVPNECLRFTVPANSIDKDNDNLFHQMVLSGFFTKMGFSPKPVNEAMCIVYDSAPKMKIDGGEVPLTGIATSWGAGLINCAIAYRGVEICSFSCTKSGDAIDEQVEKVTGVLRSKIVRTKEKKLDLDKIDENDRVQKALSIYYDETITRVVRYISKEFKEKGSEMEGEVEWVSAGGTTLPNGFNHRLQQAIKNENVSFKIYQVRSAESPFYSVGQGACIRALVDASKSSK